MNESLSNYVRRVGIVLAMTLLFSPNGRGSSLWGKIQDRYQRTAARVFCARTVRPRNPVPLISFTFDDFPQSALLRGGAILKSFGARGTYYASLGFLGQHFGPDTGQHLPVGQMFSLKDLKELLAQGHELGCHTFDHSHSWQTRPDAFEQAILKNKRALEELFEGVSFKTFSYPVSGPRPQTKKRAAKHFMCCRGGVQGFNAGRTDLNFLNAYFLREGKNDVEAIKALIDQNCRERGWLIFATHDVSDTPTPFGCSPRLFEAIVRYAIESGACVLPVADACELFVNGGDPKIASVGVQPAAFQADRHRHPASV